MDEFVEAVLEGWHCIGCEVLIPFTADTCDKPECKQIFEDMLIDMEEFDRKYSWWDK